MSLRNRILAPVSALALLAFAQPAHAQCPLGVATFGGSCYQTTSNAMTWLSAQAESRTVGGYLASIGSAAENDFLFTTFFPSLGYFWLGLNDRATEGTYAWDSGEAVVFTNWNAGEPNNDFGVEDVSHMLDDGQWNDANEDLQMVGVIEYAAVVSTPEPASLILMTTGLLGIAAAVSSRRRDGER